MLEVIVINQNVQLVQTSSLLVQQADNLVDLYYLIDQLNDAVKIFYPHNACNSGCTTCCEGTNLPAVSSLEWELIHNFIINLDKEIQQEIINRVKEYFNEYKEILLQIHENIQKPPSKEKLYQFLKILPPLQNSSCIFLVLGRCGIYPVRPAKCRAHGRFLIQFENHIQLQACNAEVDRLEEYLKKQGTRKVLMPIWNDFERRLLELNNIEFKENYVLTVIPLWLYSHIEGDSISKKFNSFPDFNSLY